MLRKAAFTGNQSQIFVYFRLVSSFFRKENVVIHFSSKMERDELVSGLRPYVYIICTCTSSDDAYYMYLEFSNFGSVLLVCFCFSFNALL